MLFVWFEYILSLKHCQIPQVLWLQKESYLRTRCLVISCYLRTQYIARTSAASTSQICPHSWRSIIHRDYRPHESFICCGLYIPTDFCDSPTATLFLLCPVFIKQVTQNNFPDNVRGHLNNIIMDLTAKHSPSTPSHHQGQEFKYGFQLLFYFWEPLESTSSRGWRRSLSLFSNLFLRLHNQPNYSLPFFF